MFQTISKSSRRTVFIFLCVGFSVALFQYVTFNVFLNVLGIDYLYATSTSFFLTVVVSFVLQKYITFRKAHGEEQKNIPYAFILFVLNSFIGLILNGGIMFGGVEWLGISANISQGISMAILATYNFFVYRVLLR